MNKVLFTLMSVMVFASTQTGLAYRWQETIQPNVKVYVPTMKEKLFAKASEFAGVASEFATNHKLAVGVTLSLVGASALSWVAYKVYNKFAATKKSENIASEDIVIIRNDVTATAGMQA